MPQEKKWVKPRPNAEYINQKDGDELMPFSSQTKREARIESLGEKVVAELNSSRAADRKSRGVDYSTFPPTKMAPKYGEKIRKARESAQENEFTNRRGTTDADWNRSAMAKESVSPQRKIAQPQKPISAAQAAMAMSGKKPVSPIRKLLKIK